jgi:hypothetical protein
MLNAPSIERGQFMILADAGLGPLLPIIGIFLVVVVLIPIICVEAAVMAWLKLLPFGRALRDSAIANIASTIVGIIMLFNGMFARPGPTDWLILWALSVVVEGAVLALLNTQLRRTLWIPTIVMNIASYLILAGLIFAFGLIR